MLIQILEPEDFPAAALRMLKAQHSVHCGPLPPERQSKVEAVFARLARKLGPDFHRDYPALRFVVSPTTGLDHIDLAYFDARGVETVSLRGRTDFLDTIHATAEHTIALALALLRDLPRACQAVLAGDWDRTRHKGRELHGKTVVLLGYGRIGRLVAPLYEAFGCRVLAHDGVAGRVPPRLVMDFPTQLAEADLLSIHLSLDPSTAGYVDGALLDRLPPEAVIVNTARGDILDQAALIERLEQGRLRGAALDVLAGEPEPLDQVLMERIKALGSRLIVTPHIGGYTWESLEAVEIYMAEQLLAAIDAAR